MRVGRFQVGPGAGEAPGWQAGTVDAVRTPRLNSPTSRLLGRALPSGTVETDLCREPILASGVCRRSLASPPARSWSHFPERKSACSGSGGTCSEEWRRRVRRCAWLNSGAPRPTRFGERGVARGRLVRTTRAPARRGSPPLRGRGMGTGAFEVERVAEGCELVKCRGPEGLMVGRATCDYGSPRGPARAGAARSSCLASSIHSNSTGGLRPVKGATPGIVSAFEHVTGL